MKNKRNLIGFFTIFVLLITIVFISGWAQQPGQQAKPGITKHADFTFTLGSTLPESPIRPLLGVNAGPVPSGEPGNADLTDEYKDIGVTMIRTHDYYGPLDMSTMYPDQNADPNNPASYNFTDSDNVFSKIVGNGFEPYLRLGNSANAPEPYKPTNYNNWVNAAVYVVRHYRELSPGKLHYVEIWNEPDNPQFWDGTKIEFFKLFAQIANALNNLKSQFSDLKIGGPGFTPAAYLANDGQYTKDFLDYLRDNNVPLDFLSWHMYSNDPVDWENAALFFRQQLDN